MIMNEHLRLLSSGPQVLIASLRQEYSVPKIKQLLHPMCYCACMFQIKDGSITMVYGSITFGMSDSNMSLIKYWDSLRGSI